MEDPDVAWIDGEVLDVNGEEIKVLLTSGKSVSMLCILINVNLVLEYIFLFLA